MPPRRGRVPRADGTGTRPYRRWTEETVVRELVTLYRQGVSITHRGLFEAGQRALIHVINYFGGFPRLRRLAGLPVPPRRWSQRDLEPEDVIKEIQRRHTACEPLAASRV